MTWDQRDQTLKVILGSQCHTSYLIYTQEALPMPAAQEPGHPEVTREVGDISVTRSFLSTVLSQELGPAT